MTKKCAIASFRLGGNDGVAVIAATWQQALHTLGWQTFSVAGAYGSERSETDILVEGLDIGSDATPDRAALEHALDGADLVLCENILSLPLNIKASEVLASVLNGRPTILHHHDLPWQQQRYNECTTLPPTNKMWRHVAINQLSVDQLKTRGIDATLIYNGFSTRINSISPLLARQRHGFAASELVLAHPVRAIERKNIAAAVALAEQINATYWLTGPAEDGYQDQLEDILRQASCKVLHQPADSLAEIYSAGDLVVFPSTWEGFGNPPIEAAIHRRPAAVGDYPVAAELRALGFQWLNPAEPENVIETLEGDTTSMLNNNHQLALQHFSLDRLTNDIEDLLTSIP